jgi:ABC-type spermidine/putrescine transport system permease subunit I
MQNSLKKLGIILVAAVIGYGLMGFLITIVQEWIFHGVSFNKSSLPVLIIAGIGTFISAVIGGWIAYKINRNKTKISNIIMSILVVLETSWLLKTYKADSPVWFDVLAALSLIIGILLACNIDLIRKISKNET